MRRQIVPQEVKTSAIPATASPGTYYIIAVADATGVVPETSETNNTKYSASNGESGSGRDVTIQFCDLQCE